MLSESQSASRKQEWAEANALAELTTEAAAKALAVVTETKLGNPLQPLPPSTLNINTFGNLLK